MNIKQLTEELDKILGINDKNKPKKLTTGMLKHITDNNKELTDLDILDTLDSENVITRSNEFKEGGFRRFVELYPEIKDYHFYLLKNKSGNYVETVGLRGCILAPNKSMATVYPQDEITSLQEKSPKIMRDLELEEINLFN